MAEPMETGPAMPRSGFLSKITSWVKRNKMVAAILAGGAALFLIKKGSGENSGPAILNESGEEEAANAIQLVPVSVSPESAEELGVGAERPETQEPSEEAVPVEESREEPAGPEPVEPPEADQPGPVTEQHGVIIHGREFPAATSFKQVRNGKDQKGSYIEYLIQFPGFTQRWHYYPASNKWDKAGDSREGGGSLPPVKTPEKPKPGGPAPGGPPNNNPPPKHPKRKPPIGVGPGHPAPGGGGGGGGGGSTSCPAGTVANIQQNRAEVQRLTGEIQSLKSNKPKGWQANVQSKEQKRNECQGAVDRGRAQPGCGNV